MAHAQVRSTGRQARDSTALEALARLGMLAHGLTYLLVGLLAVQVALGDSAKASKSGALHEIAEQPFGEVLLWVLLVGFAGYALWQIADAAFGHHRARQPRERTLARLKSLGKAALFTYFAMSTAKLLTGSASGGGAESTTAKALRLPAGQLIVGAVGVATVVLGLYLVRHGWKTDFVEELQTGRMSRTTRTVTLWLGHVGFIGLGVTVGVIGGLLVSAAVTFDPEKAAGMDQALKTLAGQPYGPYLLFAVAAGLVCYGAYCFLEARYHRM